MHIFLDCRGRERDGAGSRDGGRSAGRQRSDGHRRVLHRAGQQISVLGGGHLAAVSHHSLPYLRCREATTTAQMRQSKPQTAMVSIFDITFLYKITHSVLEFPSFFLCCRSLASSPINDTSEPFYEHLLDNEVRINGGFYSKEPEQEDGVSAAHQKIRYVFYFKYLVSVLSHLMDCYFL